MNIQKLKELIELSKLLDWGNEAKDESVSESIFIGKYVILRCRNAWVHFGKLEYANNGIYRLSESRRLYYWTVENNQWVSLSDLAEKGLDDDNKTCIKLDLIEITEKEGAETIPVNTEVVDSFKNAKVYIPN